MPRVKAIGTEQNKLAELITGKIQNGARLSRVMGVSAQTGRNRLEDAGTFTVAELVALSKRLGIPADEIRNAITF